MVDPAPHDKADSGRLTQAYERMLERVRTAIDAGEARTSQAIDEAGEFMVEVGALTRDEADLLVTWLRRDLQDAGRYLAETGSEFHEWLRLDVTLIEDRMAEWLGALADRTRLEWLEFNEDLVEHTLYRAGEVTGPGSLACQDCGLTLEFHRATRIPRCPVCHGLDFRRPEAQVGAG